MSQKSSVPQRRRSVSGVMTPDTEQRAAADKRAAVEDAHRRAAARRRRVVDPHGMPGMSILS
jgi:hypothetical protein